MTKIILPYSCVVPSGQPRGRLLIRNLHQTKLKLTDGKMYEWEKMIIVKSKLLLLGTCGGKKWKTKFIRSQKDLGELHLNFHANGSAV